MKTYITFGQVHVHNINDKTFDKDCIAVIECDDHQHGRKLAFDFFGDKFFTSYTTMGQDKMHFFPRGLIEVN